ncbi:type IV pilus biogenesis protein PilM [Evansella sp. AB-rgal1]|uniref:type IV pilus biogenesis protein PilM n=1 Tax=Evansella sp. AB-rgal1 TaxID=3242696 RepID=UPI00359E389A
MFSLTLSSKQTIGIQIKDHVIRYVATKGPSFTNVDNFGEKHVPMGVIEKGKIVDGARFQQLLEECVQDWKLKNKEIMFFIPDSSVFFRKLSIPANLEEEDIRGYLNFEIGASIHLPFDDAYFDFHILEKESEIVESRDILFFATPEEQVLEYSKKLENAKLKPIVADIGGLSLYRYFEQSIEAADEQHFLFIEWSLTSINISIFHQDVPIFMRHLAYNLGKDDVSIHLEEGMIKYEFKNKLKIDGDIDDQLLEIERVMNFYKYSMHQGTKEITNMILLGDHPMLFTTIKEKVSSLNSPATLKVMEKVRNDIPDQYLLPLSLCLKEV